MPSRREALKRAGAIIVGARVLRLEAPAITIAGEPVQITVASLSAVTARITIKPIRGETPTDVPITGELVSSSIGTVATRSQTATSLARVHAGDLDIELHDGPPSILVRTPKGDVVQRLTFDATAPGMSFRMGNGPLLGLGEGGPQFDRKGSTDRMIRGQGGYRLATHGTRAPIQWLVGTDGWGMFIHQPYGSFDFSGAEGRFTPAPNAALPLDVFVVSSRDPKTIMRGYARLTGFPELPALWARRYYTSHLPPHR